jgi:hypothetical protein
MAGTRAAFYCGLWTTIIAHDCPAREHRSALPSRLVAVLFEDDAVDKVEYDQQNEYGIHDEVYPDVGFVFFIQVTQFFEHN